MRRSAPFREVRRNHLPHDGPDEGAVHRPICLGDFRGRGKTPLVRGVVAAERTDVVERSRLASHHPLARD